MARLCLARGELTPAEAYLDEAQPLVDPERYPLAVALIAWTRGDLYCAQQRSAEAQAAYSQSNAQFMAVGYTHQAQQVAVKIRPNEV